MYFNLQQHTPLHEAALHGHAQVVELLITKGADPNQRDYQVSTNYIRS